MSAHDVVIFAGPSLPDLDIAQQRLTGDYRRPAAQGDILRAAKCRPSAIVLIDGYFERVPAVYHKEILWALGQGIPVFGAASIGALRAAELSPFGMTGIGEIYQAFVTGRLDGDDEVALVHAPGEAKYKMLSEPLVNIRWTLAAAVDDGIIDPTLHDRLIARASAMFYPERCFAALFNDDLIKGDDQINQLTEWLETGRIDQKQRDALTSLDRVAKDKAEGTLKVTHQFSFNHTDAFESLWAQVVRASYSDLSGHNSEDDRTRQLQALPSESFATLHADATFDVLALHYDRALEQPISNEALSEEVEAFRTTNGLTDSEALQQWMAARATNINALSKHLEERARIARVRGMIDQQVGLRMLSKLRHSDR